jgi:hypothetical protein
MGMAVTQISRGEGRDGANTPAAVLICAMRRLEKGERAAAAMSILG